jgi:hypothetical protein
MTARWLKKTATFSDSGVILTSLDVSTIVENFFHLLLLLRQGRSTGNCYLRIISCGLPELIA